MTEFRRITDFPRGTLCGLLTDAYSFNPNYAENCLADWREFDSFFYGNPHIADACGFMTVLDGEPVGFVSWNPRHMPEYAEIGHNCIAARHKGSGYGSMQMKEAVRRLSRKDVRKIIVTTDGLLLPAQRTYESAGFVKVRRRSRDSFNGDFIDYEYTVDKAVEISTRM